MRSHDPLNYIDPRARALSGINVPVPVPMLMPSLPSTSQAFYNNAQMMPPNSECHVFQSW